MTLTTTQYRSIAALHLALTMAFAFVGLAG